MDIVKKTGLNPNQYWQPEKPKVADGSNQKLSQQDFFKLLTEQLANQDPTKPVDNDQMVAQMTSFSMAEGITDLNKNFSDFATSMTSNQALQASSLIGQKVLVQGNVAHKASKTEGVSGAIIAEKTVQDLEISIESTAGEVIKTIKVGTQPKGNIHFTWDGKDQHGNEMPAGNYVIKANGTVEGKESNLPTAINRHVDSVSLAGSKQGIILNLDGNVSIKLDKVLQISGNKA